MIFIEPSLEEVYQTLVNNDDLINFLKSNYLLITKSNLYEEYTKTEIENMTQAIFSKNVSILYNVAEVLLNNKEVIMSNNILYLISNHIAWEDLANALDIRSEDLTKNIYETIIYTYKYCTVSSFFQNNRDKFIPENDMLEFEKNPAANAFLDAMMKEFDKLDMVLGKCCEYLDYDKIPWDLIAYLTQLLGFDRNTFNIQEEVKFRELAKNILDIYRVKGTGYSFELFFKFLGFNLNIREFYFDRRLFYSRLAGNKESDSTDRSKHEFYLTTSNPIDNTLKDTGTDEIVLPSDISPQYSLKEFDELCSKYGPEAVLGYSPVYYKYSGDEKDGIVEVKEYTDKVYKYFKTNLIYYEVGLDEGNPSPSQLKTITKCLNFLTPSYIARDIKVDTFTGGEDEDMGFDGDGSKLPDVNGNFSGFEMLDGEDWTKEFRNRYIYAEGGKDLGVFDEYDPENPYKPYVNSIGEEGVFRLPLGYRGVNKSANRFLTGATGDDVNPVYLDYKRLKHFVVRKVNGITVESNVAGAVICPYYSIPPFVKNGVPFEDIETSFFKPIKHINLTGADKEGESGKTVKTQIKEAHIVNNIDYITDLSIDELLSDPNDPFNELIPRRTMNRTLSKINAISYGPGLKSKNFKDCYFDNYYGINISNINKNNISFSDIFNIKDITTYYGNPEIFKNFTYGDYVLFKNGSETDGYLTLYRYGNYRLPIKKSENYLYDYQDYINSFNYVLSEIGKLDKSGEIRLPNTLEKSDLKEAYEDIRSKRQEMINLMNTGNSKNLKEIDYITKINYFIKETKTYYRPIRRPVESNFCRADRPCKENHSFVTLSDALSHFNNHPDEKICNTEFFVKGEKNNYEYTEENEPYLYVYEYKQRKKNKLVYSIKDATLYLITGNSKYDYKVCNDFFGKLEFYHKDIKGNYYINSNKEIEEADSSIPENLRYSTGINGSSAKDLFAEINLYDESWKGYDEQADEEDFLMYNAPHTVIYPEGKIFEKQKIGRPIKNLTDEKFDNDLLKIGTFFNEGDNKIEFDPKKNYYKSIGQNIIEKICNETVNNYTESEITNWDLNYVKVSSEIMSSIDNPSYFELFDKNGEDYILSLDTSTVEGKDYFVYSYSGLLSSIESNMEKITNVDPKDKDYDYYASVSDFIQDYYRIICYNSFDERNFPETLVNDLNGDIETNIEKIKKYYSIAMLQISVILDNLYNRRVYYYGFEKMWQTKVSEGIFKETLGVWTNSLVKYCPGLDNLWKTDPIACDPLNPIFFDDSKDSELKSYLKKHSLSKEYKKYKEYLNKLDKDKILSQSDNSIYNHEGVIYYTFKEKDSFIKFINDIIESLKEIYGEQLIYKELNEDILTKDNNSAEWCKKYNTNYGSLTEKKLYTIDYYLSGNKEKSIFLPYSLAYGINKFSKDYYGEYKEEYSKFLELISYFVKILSYPQDKKDILNNFLKQIMYNDLVSLYRESFIEDTKPLKFNINGIKPMFAVPKLSEKYDGRAGTYYMPGTLLNSYFNNGGKNDKDIRLKFYHVDADVLKDRSVKMKFRVKPSDFMKCYGFNFNPYYNKDKADIQGIINELYTKQLSCMKPIFSFKEDADEFYKGKKELTKWQRVRKFLSNTYDDISILCYNKKGYRINNDKGEIIDASGSVISNPNSAYNIIKDCFENGYLEITIISKNALDSMNNEVPEINNFVNSDDKTILYMSLINPEEKDFINGFLSIKNLNHRYIDNYVSFPKSLKWIERDEYFIANEFVSFGDDRTVNFKKIFSKKNPKYCEAIFDENGKISLKIPTSIIHTSDIKEISIEYDDGK